MTIPYIALCGWPKSGKSEVAQILEEEFGAITVDDGRALRDAGIVLYGLTEWHVSTQEGKASFVEVCGQKVQVRQLLGDLGQMLEDRYGEQVVPEMALRQVKKMRELRSDTDLFVFPSVRKTQGLAYKRAGGVVVEVVRSGVQPSPYAFDRYDAGLVDYSIVNPAPLVVPPEQVEHWRRELRRIVTTFIPRVL
ncbi:hypothetical protein [Magnetospirillum molischianum]|uniref:Dephospho-CoA kinase n=1 Tax=Magnetospirillum molischianum DSM 120 TaxID=1150626 RepID=H8FY27_MAGML|nr:hypothetical protein [Magnetospirillum molischianum]CCG43265.1 hypothetical protein PHAMO_80056 [Magnetospirillum molischianum DSM 120]